MSVNTTPFLHLPQWEANEQPSYLGEINPAFAAIDTGYGDIKTLAQTGVSSSQEAVTTANAAKAQSQANAGAITTLQQGLTRLEADFADSHNVTQVDLNVTSIEDAFAFRTCKQTYNHYVSHIYFRFDITKNFSTLNSKKIANVDNFFGTVKNVGLPFIAQVFEANGTPAGGMATCFFNGNEITMLGLGGATKYLKPGGYAAVVTLPVFIMTSRENIVDNCLYIPA